MKSFIGLKQSQKSMDELDNRKSYLDIVRIFACFMVIINHTMGLMDQYGNISIYKWFVSDIIFGICKVGVTLFVFLTGILLLDKEETYAKWGKRILHMVVLAYVWSVIYGEFWNVYFSGKINLKVLWDCLLSFVYKEGSWHLWYLYMLIGIYIMLPMLRKIAIHMTQNDWKLFLGIWFIFGMAVPFCNTIFPSIIHFHQNFAVPLFTGFVPLLFVGNYVNKTNKKGGTVAAMAVLFLAIVIIVFFTYKHTSTEGHFSRIFDDSACFPVVLEAISIFYLIKSWGGNISNITVRRILKEVSECTFGIYLLHPIFLNSIYKTDMFKVMNEKYGMSLLFLLCLQIVAFLVCFLISYVIRRIPIMNRIVL